MPSSLGNARRSSSRRAIESARMEDVLSVLVVDEDRSLLLQAGWATGK